MEFTKNTRLYQIHNREDLIKYIKYCKHEWESIANCCDGFPDKTEEKELNRLNKEIEKANVILTHNY